jgi:hypothetical protein
MNLSGTVRVSFAPTGRSLDRFQYRCKGRRILWSFILMQRPARCDCVLAYAHAVSRVPRVCCSVPPPPPRTCSCFSMSACVTTPSLPLSCRDSGQCCVACGVFNREGRHAHSPFICVLVRERRPLVGRPYARLMAVVIAPSIILMSVRVHGVTPVRTRRRG